MINKPDIEEQIPDDCTYMMNLKLKEYNAGYQRLVVGELGR